jgi:hypothetical protein
MTLHFSLPNCYKTRYGLPHYEYMIRRTCLLFRICLPLDLLHIMFIKWTASFSYRSPSVSPMPKSLIHTRTSPFSILAIYLVLLTVTPLFCLRYGCVPYMYINPCTVASNPKFDLVVSRLSCLKTLFFLNITSISPQNVAHTPFFVVLKY